MTGTSTSPHLQHLIDWLPLAGLNILDIGAGDGAMAVAIARAGARTTGLEVDAARVATMSQTLGDRIRMIDGRAEALPLPDKAFDLVTYFFSLHHVPLTVQDAALAETVRVLRPGGHVFVADPLPAGSMFELVRLLDDETVERAAAQARLDEMTQSDPRFRLVQSETYVTTRQVADLQSFIQGLLTVDPSRAVQLPSVHEALEQAYAKAPRDGAGRALFQQPVRACLFKLATPCRFGVSEAGRGSAPFKTRG